VTPTAASRVPAARLGEDVAFRRRVVEQVGIGSELPSEGPKGWPVLSIVALVTAITSVSSQYNEYWGSPMQYLKIFLVGAAVTVGTKTGVADRLGVQSVPLGLRAVFYSYRRVWRIDCHSVDSKIQVTIGERLAFSPFLFLTLHSSLFLVT
jgi:hypothetical protein